MAGGAKKFVKKPEPTVLKYPSWFGSHKSMVDEEATNSLSEVERAEFVMCRDDYGVYKTELNRLDNKLADPHRNTTERLKSLFKKIKTD